MSQPVEAPAYDPHARLAEARAKEDAWVAAARALWARAKLGDEATQHAARDLIELTREMIEDEVDSAAANVAMLDPGEITAEQLWAELGLDDEPVTGR